METKNVILFIIVGLIFLVIVSVVQNSFSGKVASTNNAYRGIQSCYDSDGDSMRVSGYVDVTRGAVVTRYEDRCVGGGLKVLENYCTVDSNGNKVRGFKEIWCVKGEICDGGKCIIDKEMGSSKIYGPIVV